MAGGLAGLKVETALTGRKSPIKEHIRGKRREDFISWIQYLR
jgi:hypothetical protein